MRPSAPRYCRSKITKTANVRHLRKIRLTPRMYDELRTQDAPTAAEVLGQVPGAMVVISAPTVGFNIGQLVRTMDDRVSWIIQWFNIKDAGVSGKSRLAAPYLPCWTDKGTGVEARSTAAPDNSDPMQYTVKQKRFKFKPFSLKANGCLPDDIKASLRGQYRSSLLSY